MVAPRIPIEIIMQRSAVAVLALALALAACGKSDQKQTAQTAPAPVATPVPDPGPVPQGPLPRVATPTHYRLAFTIDPTKAGFSGHDEIDVNFAKKTRTLYIHGLDIEMKSAMLRLGKGQTVAMQYKQVDKSGVALLTFARDVPAGAATLVFDYDAPYDQSLAGLYKVIARGDAYAFTQFEEYRCAAQSLPRL
jgi:aminopeptidase N